MLKIPLLICLNDYSGNWENYEEVLYAHFKRDFINPGMSFNDAKIICIKEPLYKGKEFTFWHIITEGEVENERIPNMKRCERICWPKAIVENHLEPEIKTWINERKNKKGKIQKRLCFCLGDWEYIVILDKRNNYYLFCTSYPISNNRKQKLKKEYELYKKQTPPL